MLNESFADHYELLQISTSAESETIQRVFRMLAQRYHPDNAETGNFQTFESIVKAYKVLSDPVLRAAYDVEYRENKRALWQVFDAESAASTGPAGERRKREGILSVLYRKRQRQPDQAGMNYRELEEVLGIPKEHMEFAFWYLRESQAVKGADNGRMLITIKGVELYEALCEGESRGKMIPMLTAGKEALAS